MKRFMYCFMFFVLPLQLYGSLNYKNSHATIKAMNDTYAQRDLLYEQKDLLNQQTQSLVNGPLDNFITHNNTTDNRYQVANAFMWGIERVRVKNQSQDSNLLSVTAQKVLNTLEVYEGCENKVEEIVQSSEFKKLKKTCEKLVRMK